MPIPMRVAVKPSLLRWARDRSGRGNDYFAHRFPQLATWLSEAAQPTFKQLQDFASASHTPIGFLYLSAPPVESVPIPDFRTVANTPLGRPSPDLLETIYICQQRQEWYRDFARSMGETPRAFVGSLTISDNEIAAAEGIRTALGFDREARREASTWTEALRSFIEQADTAGIMVMCSGVVLNNNTRTLNPNEFRGFALSDDLAPLVFVNGSDTKSAQMFTLAHELAHLWLGRTSVSDAQASEAPDHEVERWCNRVAAEILVPIDLMRREFQSAAPIPEEMARLARRFKVSTLVVLRRIRDVGGLDERAFWTAYNDEEQRLKSMARGSGGNFYLTQAARVSKRFARALVSSTLEGQTLHRDAFRLLGFHKVETFEKLGHSLGVAA